MAKVDRKLVNKTPFKDISLSFSRHPVTDDIGVFVNEDAIKRSVTNLVRTRVGERFYQKLLGSPLEDSLFEQQDSDTAAILEDDILLLLENYEPRIKNVDVVCSYDLDSTDMNVRISYIIAGLQFPQQNIEFILQSTRV
jgi:phage baseplate assembly protein W|tara:strand:- start:4948 stop:5364 length:417 start_codon:yes stop_codon:yes gene_type:complete